jgi:hypothetical protein
MCILCFSWFLLFLVFWSDDYDLAGLYQLQLFAGKFLDCGRIGTKGLNIGCELFIISVEFRDIGLEGGELVRLSLHFERALVVEDGKKQHRNGEQAKHGQSDSNDNALH